MNLRQWQKEGWDFFLKNNNCIFQVATGSGKTYMAIFIIKKLLELNPNIKTLVVGPKNVIIEQAWMNELNENGFPINKVGLYNQSAKEFSQITLCSIQSLKRLIETGMYDMFDLVIFDEVHNYGSVTYIPYIEYPKKYKIGLTATLEREDMNHIVIKKHFGFNVFDYDISDALKDEVLNPFHFYHINIPMTEDIKKEYNEISDQIKFLKSIVGNIKYSKLNKNNPTHNKLLYYIQKRLELINNYEKKKHVIFEIINRNKLSKILIFNQYNKVSTNLYWELSSSGTDCEIINSTIDKKMQERTFQQFEKGDLKVLLATTMLDEGYNLPKIDIAILMAQNSTRKQFIQRMGRVLRKKENPSKVYYLTVEGTFEEENFINKKDFIIDIALSYNEEIL
jgi:superfamily II DNA or RNA helicase